MSAILWAQIELSRLEDARDAGDLAGAAREALRVLSVIRKEHNAAEYWDIATRLQAIVNESTRPVQHIMALPLDGQLSMF